MRYFTAIILAAAACAMPATAGAAAAHPVTDCPGRDAPFSVNAPLIDILLSPAARGVAETRLGISFAHMPAIFVRTDPPSFAAILSLREAAGFMGKAGDALIPADAALHAVPITAADRSARCARYDNDRPHFDLPAGKRHILLFEKINGFRDGPSVDAAHAAFVGLAAKNGWTLVTTQSGGAFTSDTLARFDVVIWNNISGDVLTLSQRAAFKAYMARGGGFLGVHGSGGDPAYFWDWYADTLLGARFKGHPMAPQFQAARITIEDPKSPLAKGLTDWTMTDEWYSFKASPRGPGTHVLAALDEATYHQVGMGGQDLRMGDHPIVWTRCIGRGRMVYSAIGHRPEGYTEPHYALLLENAMRWLVTPAANTCRAA